jgi:hypothetical protein
VARSIGRAILVPTIFWVAIWSGPRAAAQQPKLPGLPGINDVLDRLGAYLVEYEQRLSLLVAEERYEQQWVGRGRPPDKRVLTSDYVMLRVPGGQAWTGFRDTFEVDGRPVREQERRLESILVDGSDDAYEQANRIAEENARYNLGSDVIHRTINIPMLTLDLLHPRHRSRFTFRKRGTEVVENRNLWKLEFTEEARPSLIRTPAGPDQITRGSAWIDPDTGMVLRTYLNVVISPTSQAKISVDYRPEETLELLVPFRMQESYQQTLSRITTTATYSNFRQFQTSARVVETDK